MMHTNTTMQAAVLHRAGDFRMEWVPRKEPANGEVEIRILCNGICGSDVHFYREGRLGPFVVDRPYIPGHECSGIVSSVGSGVTTVREGDRVVAEPGIPCRHCHHCLSGRYNLCTEVRFLSAPPIDGTLAEYVIVPDLWAHPFPDSLEAEVAALAEPFAVGLHAIRRGGVQLGQKVAVDAKQLISHRYPFSKTPEAFAMVAANPQTVIKTLILQLEQHKRVTE